MPVGNLIHAVIPEKRHIVKDLLDAMISNFPEERILRNIQLANQKSKQNYAGFLGRAVREDWAATNPPEEKSGKIDQELKAARKAEFMSDMQAMFDLENQLLEMPAAALEKLRDRFRATIGHQPAVLNIFSIEGVRYPDFLFFCHNQLGNKENEE